MKSSRAFVSFIRSFKEHRLSNILKFKNMDIYSVARSFFLFKLPVIRDLLEVTLDQPLATEEELAKFDKTEFLDKNQETMIKAKIEEARSKRQDVLVKRAHRKEQIEKEAGKRKVRSKAERNRAKTREQTKEYDELTREAKLEKKLKKSKISKTDYEEEIKKIDKKHEYRSKSKPAK